MHVYSCICVHCSIVKTKFNLVFYHPIPTKANLVTDVCMCSCKCIDTVAVVRNFIGGTSVLAWQPFWRCKQPLAPIHSSLFSKARTHLICCLKI